MRPGADGVTNLENAFLKNAESIFGAKFDISFLGIFDTVFIVRGSES